MTTCEVGKHKFVKPRVEDAPAAGTARTKERQFWSFCRHCGAILECGLNYGSRPTILAPKVKDIA